MTQASGIVDILSKISPVLVHSVDETMSAAESSTRSVARTLLDASGSGEDSNIERVILSSLTPLFVGVALAVCVLVAYVLFVLISLCCKCCNNNRGCCQTPQHLTYKQRLPFIVTVALPALLGLIGGILVLSAGPGLVKAFQGLIDALLEQYDIIVNILDSMYNDGVRAAELAETDSSDLDPVKDLLDAIKEFRDEDIAEYNEQAGGYFKLVQTIAMLTGGGLIATGVLGIVAPASLKNFLLVGFLCHTALLSSVPFVVWGALTFVGTAGSHICTELDTVMSGGQSNLLNPADTCPDPAEIQENIGGPITSMNEATASLNSLLEEANSGSASAFSALQTECNGFAGPGSTYYDALCSTGTSVDAQLMTSIYQCVDSTKEGIATFDIFDALQNTDTSCTWHGTNYPSVDFGAVGSVASIEACFRTATATINSNDGNFRGIVAAATAEYAPLLQEESFVRGVLATLPLACEFNTGSDSIEFTAELPVMPPLCAPFTPQPTAWGDLIVPTNATQCEMLGQTAFENFSTTFETFKCTPEAVTLNGADTEDNRKRCTIAGKPIFEEDYDSMANYAEAITIFQRVLTNLNLWATCQIFFNVLVAVQTNCHPIPNAAKKLATGMLLCGIGFSLASLMVCSCWRKLNKPKASIEPYNEFK